MQIHSVSSERPLPSDRAYVMSMVIKSFKGRRDVEVHLFRPEWADEEEAQYQWQNLLGSPIEEGLDDPAGSRKVVLEAFTTQERDQVFDYLQERYADRVSEVNAQPMNFPVPLGLTPMSAFPEGKSIGVIRLSKVPNYTLPFALHGLYDLSQHKPLVEDQD